MVTYCPNCGAEVKKGMKFCAGCGNQIQVEAPAQTPPPAAPVQQQQPIPPPVAPQQAYTPMGPKKSNTKLIIGIIVAVVAIVVVLLIVFLVFGGNIFGGGSAGDFVGTWTVSSYTMDGEDIEVGSGSTITFISDGTYTASGATGTWELTNNKIYIASSTSGSGQFDNIGMDYSFSNNKNSLTLSYNGIDNYGDYVEMSMLLVKT